MLKYIPNDIRTLQELKTKLSYAGDGIFFPSDQL